jgi:hypothetical protein
MSDLHASKEPWKLHAGLLVLISVVLVAPLLLSEQVLSRGDLLIYFPTLTHPPWLGQWPEPRKMVHLL